MSALAERIAKEHAAVVESLPASAVAAARRRRAIERLLATGLPTSREESWRYANLRPLERVRFVPARTAVAGASPGASPGASAAPAGAALPDARSASSSLAPALPGFARYVFVDGVFAPEASVALSGSPGAVPRGRAQPDAASPDGTRVGSPTSGAAGASTAARITCGAPIAFGADVERPDSAFAWLNEAFALDGLRIEVGAAEHEPLARVEVVFVASASAQQGASYPRLSVIAAPHARLELVERHVSLADEASFVDSAVDVRAEEGASIEHYRIQQLGSRAVWLDTLAATVGSSAAYRLHAFALGAQSARSTLHVRLDAASAEVELHAVSAGDRQQVLDTYALVEHAAPRTRTRESFRGIAAGRSRVAFNGKIIVHPGSHGADSSQSLRGLLAGSEAEIDVRPQLEIYTDDVRCSHGATAGKLDESMLFYLLSRGLDRDTAQRLLKWAFLEDVVSKVAVAELRRQIEWSLAGRLPETETLKELL